MKKKRSFFGNERTKYMQILNLKRKFETLKMNDSKTIKKFMSKVMKIMNKIKLMGEQFLGSKIVEKILMVFLENFKSKISSLEESKDPSKISMTKLVNAF